MHEHNVVRQNQVLVLEGRGATISIALGASAAFQQGFLKASPDDPVHPGWPAGTPGGLGGKFRPKDGSAREAAETAIHRTALRRAIRTLLMQTLSLPFEVAANIIPALGEAADVIMVGQLAETAAEFQKLNVDTQAALDFIANGPYSLDALRVSPDSESFSSYDQFYKGLVSEDILALRFGSAGPGYEYHHIVEQGGPSVASFPARELQSTDNIIRIPTLLHQAINAEYSRGTKRAGLTVRQWLQTQSSSLQREEGIQILRDLGIIR
jgi:hypothetical protein